MNFAAAPDYTVIMIALGAFFVGGPLIFTFVLWLISRFGWRKFSAGREYPGQPNGTTVSVINMVFGRSGSYNNGVVATFTPEGIYLRPRWILKPFHPPFFVTWDMVTSCRKRSFFRFVRPEFEIRDGTSVLYVRLTETNYALVEPVLPPRLRGAQERE